MLEVLEVYVERIKEMRREQSFLEGKIPGRKRLLEKIDLSIACLSAIHINTDEAFGKRREILKEAIENCKGIQSLPNSVKQAESKIEPLANVLASNEQVSETFERAVTEVKLFNAASEKSITILKNGKGEVEKSIKYLEEKFESLKRDINEAEVKLEEAKIVRRNLDKISRLAPGVKQLEKAAKQAKQLNTVSIPNLIAVNERARRWFSGKVSDLLVMGSQFNKAITEYAEDIRTSLVPMGDLLNHIESDVNRFNNESLSIQRATGFLVSSIKEKKTAYEKQLEGLTTQLNQLTIEFSQQKRP